MKVVLAAITADPREAELDDMPTTIQCYKILTSFQIYNPGLLSLKRNWNIGLHLQEEASLVTSGIKGAARSPWHLLTVRGLSFQVECTSELGCQGNLEFRLPLYVSDQERILDIKTTQLST